MKPTTDFARILCACILTAGTIFFSVHAAETDPAAPIIRIDRTTNGQPRLVFPYPAAQQYNVFSSSEATNSPAPDVNSGRLLGPSFIVTNGDAMRFYKVRVTPMSSNDVFAATVLNRLTYGPTPDDIDRIRSIGPQAFIDEQMAWNAIPDTLDTDPPITNAAPPAPALTNWTRVSAVGTAGGRNFGISLTGPGTVYIDNVSLVFGTNAETGPNLLINGDFEDPALRPPWTNGSQIRSAIVTNSPTMDGLAASGTNCLLLSCNSSVGSLTTTFFQQFLPTNASSTQRMTLTYYYLPVQQTNAVDLLARVSAGGQLGGTTGRVTMPYVPAPPAAPPSISVAYNKLASTNANIEDLRAWHVYRAIHSKRQLHEVLAQFFQNHFTTQYGKTEDYFDNNFNVASYTNDAVRRAVALDLHWREHKRFRDALLNPNCNFYDLLKISIESEAMIIYLDTLLNSKAAPNQNYAREIMELHTMGADNGYIQQDIVDLAKVWTGWRVDKKDPSVADNPFAAPISRSNRTNFVNAPGFWVLHFTTNNHDTTTKRLFTNNVISPRFGPQFGGGASYALFLSNTLATGTNGFAEGYKVAQHLADLPYTMEFVSSKLCNLFVNENFQYGVYDYTAPDLSPEAQLLKDCMTAWNTPAGDGRKGNLRSVLTVIFNSALFRGHGSSQQKVKTPLEYAVSAVRALRVTSNDTNGYATSTCDSDGYGISGLGNTYPLSRMGGMALFNKAEPDGWSEYGRIWLNTANLCERMRFVQHLLMPTTSSTKDDDYGNPGKANTSDPVALLKLKTPSSTWNDAGAVADFFLGLFFPGEGAGNLGRDREAAINYLNTTEAGVQSDFNMLTGAAYDGRVRSMVGFLLSLPRFQEQ